MSTTRPERLFLGVFSLCLALYALIFSTWKNPYVLIALTIMIIAVEFFPVKVGKTRLPLVVPFFYTMALHVGAETTILLGSLSLAITHIVHRQPLQIFLFTSLARGLALLLGCICADAVLASFDLDRLALSNQLLHLITFLLVYVTVAVALHMWKSAVASANYHQARNSLLQAGIGNLMLGFLYCGAMYWIASQETDPYTAAAEHPIAQAVAITFFYLPLVAFSVVMNLITTLSQTKTRLESLFDVSQSFAQPHDMQQILERVIREGTKLVHGNYGLLYLVQEGGSLQQFGTSVNFRIPKGAGLVGLVASTGQAMLIPDVLNDPRLHPGETHAIVRNLLLVPIHIDGKVAGVISLGKKELDPFQRDDLKLMSIFATQAAAVMKKAKMTEEREKRLVLEERNRLAREIHDGIAQDLAGIIFQVDLIKRSDQAGIPAKLDELQEMLRKSVATVRHSIYSLRPAPYAQLGLVPAMRQQLDELESQHGIYTHFSVQLPPDPMPTPITKAVFQIFTEAVQNVVKHADAKDLHVQLEGDEEAVTLSIRDNGQGFHFGKAIVAAAARHSFGIENLHNIADEIGGTLDYVTSPGAGTEVILRIPLKEENENDDSRVAL